MACKNAGTCNKAEQENQEKSKEKLGESLRFLFCIAKNKITGTENIYYLQSKSHQIQQRWPL